MADYNYTNIDFILDLNIEKNKKFFEDIQKKENEYQDEAVLELETLFSDKQEVEIEWLSITEVTEKNECLISMNFSYKYETPKEYITAFHKEFNCKVNGSSSTYDYDYTTIYTDEKTGELQFNEYADNEAYIMRTLVDDESNYYVDFEDFSKYLITFKNKKLIKTDEGFYDLLLKQNKGKVLFLLSDKTEVGKRYSIFFNELSDKDKKFLEKNNIKIESFMIFKEDVETLSNYLEDMAIYLPIAFIPIKEGEQLAAKYF